MNKNIVLDLKGTDGNAFVLLSVAKDLSHKNKFNWDNIYSELTKGRDYNTLVSVMENYFGDQITFLGKQK